MTSALRESSEPAARERPLGDIEYIYWLMDHGCRTNFVVAAELCGEVSEDAFRQALARAQQRYPALRLRIVVRDGEVVFRAAPGQPVPLRIVPAESAQTLAKVAEQEQGQRFDTEQGPLARALLLHQEPGRATLLLTFHHAVADARSGTKIVHDVVRWAGEGRGAGDFQAPAIEIDVPMSRRVPSRYRGLWGLLLLLRLMIRQLWLLIRRGPTRREVNDARAAPDERVDRFVCLAFSAAETAAVVEAARARGVTVHGALCAAQLLSIAREWPKRRRVTLGLSSLVSLRERLDPPAEDTAVGPKVSLTTSSHRVGSPTGFWDLAAEIRLEIGDQIRAGYPWVVLPSLAQRIRRRRLHLGADGRAARRTFRRLERLTPAVSLVSNCGRIPGEGRFGNLTLESLHFLMALSSSARLGSAATTFRGQLRWNFTYGDPAVQGERAERIANRAREILLEACHP